MPLSPVLRTVLSLGMTITAVLAQSEKAEEALILRSSLSDSQQQFEAKLANATASLDQTFLVKLRQFERQAARAEDFPKAIAYRDRSLALTAALQRHNPNQAKERAAKGITPALSEASLAGSVFLQRKVLKGRKASATAAIWNLRGLTPGSYEIVVTYSCTKIAEEKSGSGDKRILLRAGGQFSFGETSRLLNGERQSLIHEVQPTADWETYRDVSLGILTFSNAAVSLRLNVIEAKPLGLMHLQRIQLLPVEQRVDTKPIPNAADLQRSFQSAVKRRKEKIQVAYIHNLKTLQKRAKSLGNNQLVQDIARAINTPSPP